jgi:hypothetical protein
MVQLTISSDERRELRRAAGELVKLGAERFLRRRDCSEHAQGMFLVLATLGSLALLAPKIGCRRFCRTRLRDANPAPPSPLLYGC